MESRIQRLSFQEKIPGIEIRIDFDVKSPNRNSIMELFE